MDIEQYIITLLEVNKELKSSQILKIGNKNGIFDIDPELLIHILYQMTLDGRICRFYDKEIKSWLFKLS